jgi:hypothetical protein
MSKRNPYGYKHCCSAISANLEDYRVPIDFDPIFRSYFIPFMWPDRQATCLSFCPWCGIKFSKSLEDEFEEIVAKEYGLKGNALELLLHNDLPEEFKDESWWQKRGL